jgi:hypothetical protein
VDRVADRVRDAIGAWPGSAGLLSSARPERSMRPTGAEGSVLWLTGPTGVGKSTIGFRAYLRLLGRGLPAAYVDIDQIGFCATGPTDVELRAANLAAVWTNYRSVGAESLVVAGKVADRAEARFYEEALPQASFTWMTLHAEAATLTERILTRGAGGSWPEPGDPLKDRPTADLLGVAAEAVAEANRLALIGPGSALATDGLAVDVAAEVVLRTAGWLE